MSELQITDSKNSILLCLDLEEGSRELAEFCKLCARDWQYPVHVLHVHCKGGRYIKETESDLKAIVNEILGGANVAIAKIIIGTPEEDIIEFASQITNTPIIMIGRRKRTIADRIYIGSTTSSVLSLSKYPVMVVPIGTTL